MWPRNYSLTPVLKRIGMIGKFGAYLCSVIILPVTVCVAGPVGAPDQNEPAYQGRTLSEWTRDLDPHGLILVGHEPPALAAIGHIGTNAIPTLLKWMSEPDPLEVPKTNVPPCYNTTRSQRACMAFAILGETAGPAIPELTRLARTSSDAKRAERCVECLAGIGPESVSSLLSLATNGPPLASWHAFHALYDFKRSPVAVAIAPVLLKCLGDEREDVVGEAVSLLGWFDLPDVVVPALTNALRSSSTLTRLYAVQGLGFHEEKASSTIPLLRAAMRDPNYRVRESATNVLRGWGGWELDNAWRWVSRRDTSALNGITPDLFTDGSSSDPGGRANERQPLSLQTNRTPGPVAPAIGQRFGGNSTLTLVASAATIKASRTLGSFEPIVWDEDYLERFSKSGTGILVPPGLVMELTNILLDARSYETIVAHQRVHVPDLVLTFSDGRRDLNLFLSTDCQVVMAAVGNEPKGKRPNTVDSDLTTTSVQKLVRIIKQIFPREDTVQRLIDN
jgi:hypothetical protein